MLNSKLEELNIYGGKVFGIKQEKKGDSEKYFISNKSGKNILFSIKKSTFFRNFFSTLVFISGIIFAIFYLFKNYINFFTLEYWLNALLIMLFFFFISFLFSPKINIKFFISKNEENFLFKIEEKSTLFPINKKYLITDNFGNILCKIKKNLFINFFRKKWLISFKNKEIFIKEEFIFLGLLRKFIPFGYLIKTNFIFIEKNNSQNILGIFKRRFELSGNFELNMEKDENNLIPKEIVIGMAILLDIGENG